MNFKTLLLISLSAFALSCSGIRQDMESTTSADGISVRVTAPGFVSANNTKSTISTSGAFAWSAGDRIGIFSNQIGAASQTATQLAFTLSAGEGTSVAYTGTTGWSLVTGSTFNYFSCYPYSESNSREQISIDYTGQTQTANNSTAHIGEYDYMYSDMAAASSSSSASFIFHHIGCLTNVNITVPAGYENTTFYSMRLYAESELFTSSATYSVNDIVSSGTPSLDAQNCSEITLSFGDTGIKPTNGAINAWVLMAPVQWMGHTITVKLYDAMNNIPALAGNFNPNANQTAGTQYSYSLTASKTGQILPEKPASGEQLHILLFGHSFGLDCTDYLPAITKAAGITDVHYGRWYRGNCSLSQHWDHITSKETNKDFHYYDSNPAAGKWESPSNRRGDDVLAQYPWDIIIFQQSTGFSGEGNYSSYQPYLNNLTEYVTDYCETVHGKTPVIGWNMFWGFNSGQKTDYDRGEEGALAMYNAIVIAAQAMVADKTKASKINLIIPTGTAIQNARGTSLNDPGSAQNPSTTLLLTRDGAHSSLGIGRYVTACTWFQKIIAPIYGVSITGNSYRPYPYVLNNNYSFEGDQITDSRAAICWQCAIEAVNHPYEVTPIVEN